MDRWIHTGFAFDYYTDLNEAYRALEAILNNSAMDRTWPHFAIVDSKNGVPVNYQGLEGAV